MASPLSTWSITSTIRSALLCARRNRGKVALFTVTAGTAIAAAAYFRRQAHAINSSIDAERTQGAQFLRRLFLSNTHSIRHAFRNLLPTLRARVAACSHVDTSRALARLRERPSDIAEKQALWQHVKTASLTHLLTAVYMTALLYSFLTLQMNLLARYNVPEATAAGFDNFGGGGGGGSLALPGGPLSSATSKRFLDLVLQLVLDDGVVKRVAEMIARSVKRMTVDFDLAHTPNVEEVDSLLRQILADAWGGEPPSHTPLSAATNGTADGELQPAQGEDEGENDGEVSGKEDTSGECLSLRDMLLHSLFNDMSQQCRGISSSSSDAIRGGRSFDANYAWLVCESLDLCEVLEFPSLVFATTNMVSSFAVERMRDDLVQGANGKAQTFARLLARFSSMGSTIVTCRETVVGDGSTDGGSDGSAMEDVDSWLLWDQGMKDFGASVFVSGEKDAGRGSNDMSNQMLR